MGLAQAQQTVVQYCFDLQQASDKPAYLQVAPKTEPAAEPKAEGAAQSTEPMAVNRAPPAAADSLAFDMAAPQSRVEAVSTSAPAEDFEALLQQGRAEKAFEGLQAVILTLVDTSIGGRYMFSFTNPPILSMLA